MGQAEVGHHSGAPERHRVDGGQVRREGRRAVTARLPHNLRSDAPDNRERILDAARAAIVDEGLADPDPWHGFCLVIEKVCELHARNRGFAVAFRSAYPNAMDVAAGREYALNSV